MKTLMSTAGAGAAAGASTELPDVLPAGAKCGPWIVEREIGRGGMGAVYAVVHEDIGKRAALKIVHRRLLTPAFNIDRVMLEAKVVNAVGHPNIVDIFETGKLEDGRPYVVMERLEGQALSCRADDGKIQPDLVIGILLQVCDALIAAHAAHIVHRDLKLDNVFLVDNVDGSPSAIDAAVDSARDATTVDATSVDAAPIDAPEQRYVRIQINMSGAVNLAGGGSCHHTAPMNTCVFAVPTGAVVQLQAIPDPEYRFDKWESGPCVSQGATCAFLPTLALTEVNVKFREDD